MLTKKDIQALEKLLDIRFKSLEKKLDSIGNTHINYSNDLQDIKNKLDEFIVIIKHYSERQAILEEKMKAIEEYFDSQQDN